MKKLFLSLTALVFATAMFAQKKADEVAKFATETIDQGKLKQNNPEEVKFIVTNISKEPLIIEQANPTCGCTIGDYTKTPIAPGATGFVSAKFNAASLGHFEKHLTVKFAGADDIKNIVISGDVLAAEEYDKWKMENPAPALVKAAPVAPAAKVVTTAVPVKAKSATVKSVKAKPATSAKTATASKSVKS
ncbi:DUF1573 domain-containing protein [Ferruginibacter sp. SUN106]|uniref:DUF1573 domain-containing protein n=1 Tax=Ferruginibacter sp. SUN106 TaxID=2978348 RepID=UPI003D363EDE